MHIYQIITLYPLNLPNVVSQLYLNKAWRKDRCLIISVVSLLNFSLQDIEQKKQLRQNHRFFWTWTQEGKKEYPSRKIEQVLILLRNCWNSKTQQPLAECVLKGFIYLIVSLYCLTFVLLPCNIRQNTVLTIASLYPVEV